MDRTNGGLSSKCAVLIPVSKSSVVFEKVLAPLQKSFLYEESKEAFRYPSAFLFNNSILQEKYEAFRANRRAAGYSAEELGEEYGFLLFDDIDKAAKLGETGVLTGNSTCKTLGDPSKGVYIARYSDCLAPDHWYSGKSGFIVIIRLTKGRSNKVKENYTQNCITPSVGFDCHESKELPLVSANTSSFLAYERTQYYLYEVLPGDCSNTHPAPSHVCPFAIVPFSYDDANTKATMSSSQEQRETEGKVLNDFMWRGQLHISSQIFHVRLKSRSGTLVPVKLPPVVKVDQAVSMVTLRQFAPKAVFETCFSGEVCLDGICCSVHEFIPEELEDPSLSLLIRELKDKDLGLTVHLNESGFLILLHSSNFATCTGNQSRVTESLQAMFLFPGSRTIQRDTRGELEHFQISSDILQILPALDYAETEMQKIPIGPSGDIRGQFEQQIKNYAALVQTGLAGNSSKDVSPLSQDYYDESVTSLFSNPKWTNRLWQWLRSYLSHPDSFQLPVYSVTELLAAGNKLQKEVFNEDLPSLEQAPGTVCSVVPEELLTRSTACDVSSSWQKDVDKKDSETNSVLNGPSSRNPTAELVVSITSAEGTSKVVDKGLRGSDAVVATKQLSNTPMKPLENSTPGATQRKPLGRPRGRPKGKRKRFKWSSPPADEPLNSTPESPDEETNPAQSRLDNDSPETEWTILSTSQCKGGKLTYKYKKVPRSPQLQEDEKQQTKPRRSTRSTRYDPCSLLRKTDRWDLRPILTACGRTLVPHGYLNSLLQKNECKSTNLEQHFKETVSETSEEASQLEKTDPVAGGLAANTANKVNSGDTCPNTELGSPRCETSNSPPESRVKSMVLIAEADSTGGMQSSAADDSLPLQYRNNSERLLFKLKKLFSRKKNTQLGLDDSVSPVDATLSTEPSPKKSKSDMDGEPLSTESNTECQDSRGRNNVSIAFLQALGLRPIVPGLVPGKMEETRLMVTLQPWLPLSPEAHLIPLEVNSAQVLHMGPLPIQEKPKVERPLKKRRRKWGKRLTTPSSFNAETPENEESAKSNSVETNLKELFRSNGQSNALSLLADLALGDGNNQAQPQLNPLSMKKPDPRSDVDNRLNDGTKPDNRSVLPSTLQHPADSPLLPSNCPSPEGILGSKDVIGLIAQEHDYSWSSASQVPNTSSPAGIPEHSQKGPLEGPSEHKAAVGHMTRDAIGSRRFRRSRTFVEREGVLQVTRKWKGRYDFDLDSKFTNHPVEKTVCRGLHGSWNSAGKDGGEEAQLLIHMWIGLFYSRSTPRFIHSSPLDLEDCPEKSDGIVSAPTVPETAPIVIGHSDGQNFEPIQEGQHFLKQGEEILDLSIKKQDVNDCSDVSVSHHETKGKEASETITREAGRPDEDPAQCQAIHRALEVQPFHRPSKLPWAPNLPDDKVQPMTAKNVDVARVDQVYKCLENEFDNNDGNDVNIIKSTSKRSDTSTQSATNLEHSAVNSLSEDKTCDSLGKVIANINIQPQLIVEAQASIDPETSEMEERKENLENAEVAGDPPIEMDSACDFMKGIAEDGIEENDRDDSKREDTGLPLMDYEDPANGHKSPVPYVSLPDDETQSAVRFIPLPHGSKENWNEDEDGQSARDQGHFTKEKDNHLKPKSVSDRRDDPGGSDVSVVSCDQQEQDDKLVGKEVETASILAQNAASHQRAHSPQNGVSKLLQDPSEMPIVGTDDSKQEVEAGPQVLPSQDSPLELTHEPKEMPMSIYMYRKPLENGEKVPIVEKVHSVFDSTHKLGSEDREVDKRCPPPAKVYGPGYFTLSLVGEPYEGDGTKEISSDEMLWMQYANTDFFMADGSGGDYDDGDDAISEGNFNLTLDESISEEHDDDSMDDVDSEIESQQSNSDNHSTPLQEGIEGKSQAKVETDIGAVSCAHQEPYDDLVENEVESACILAKKAASQHLYHSLQDGVSNLLQDSNERPLDGKDGSKQAVEAGPQVLPLQDSPVELVHKPKEMPMSIVFHTLLENGEKVQTAENILSVFQDRDSKHELGTEKGKLEERCLKPSKWDVPVVYCQATLVQQSSERDSKKDAASDDKLQMQCENSNILMAGGGSGDVNDNDQDDTNGYDTISEENLSLELDKTLPDEHDNIDSKDEANVKIVIPQNMSDNDSTPIKNRFGVERQAEVEPDVSVVSCNHQEPDDELVGKEVEAASILAQKAASRQPSNSPQDRVSKLLQDSSEMPLVCKQVSKQEVDAGPQVLPLQDSPVELAHEPKEMPMSIVFHTLLENREKVQTAENILSVFQDRDSKHELGTEEGKLEERCLKPSKWDVPVVYCQATLVQQSSERDSKKNAASDDMLQMQCENLNILMAGGGSGDVNDNDQDDTNGYDTISEENLSLELDKTLPDEHDNIDSKDEANVKIVIPQNMSDNDSTPIKNGFGVERQAEVEPDVSVVSCNHQEPDDELVGKEVEAASILAQKAASRQPSNSPQDGVSKLLQDSSEMPLVGKQVSKQEVDAGPQVLPLQDSPVELGHEPKEMALNIDVYRTLLENGDKVQIADNLISVFEDRDSTHKLGSEDSEKDEQCLPPTMGDGPVGYFTLSIVGEPYEGIGTKDAETAFISAQKAASPQPSHYPQYGVDSKQVEAGPQVLHLETAIEPNEMGMNKNVFHMSLENSEKFQIDENIPSAFKECNCENKLGSETSEFDERCPTPTVDEDPYEEFPSRISNQVCKIVPEEECGKSSTLSHLSGKEVDAEPVLKAGRNQDPGRDLLEDNQTPSYRLLETIELPPSLHQSPTLYSESMDMDNLNDGTRLVNVGITPAKKSRVKRSRFSDIVPCPPRKMNIIQEICEAPVRVLTGLERTEIRPTDIYRVKDMDNPSFSKTSDDNQPLIPFLPNPLIDKLSDNRRDISNHTSKGDQHENEQEICSRADRVSVHGVGECVPKQTNDIDALYHVEEQGHLKPSRTVPSSVSMQSGEGENLSSSSCQDPFKDCPVEKGHGPSSFNYTDPSSSSFKYTNYRFTKTVSNSLGNITEKCMNSDLTQFSIEQDFLIFSEEMKKLLNGNKRGPGKNPNHRSMNSHPSSDRSPSIIDRSMDEDMPESGVEEPMGKKRKNPSSRRGSTEANGALCDIEAVCARWYRTMMDNVCAGKSYLTETDGALRECSSPIKKMRSEMFGGMNQGLNMVVRKSSKTKFKFFILTTSEDAFFKDTKAQLEGAGHTEEQPYHFLLSKQSSSSSLLLIILKNEDIAEHIIKVPHLLQLKKSANVLFAGIDHPKDIGNLTHQDIFKKGGFIMLEGASLESLNFGQMKALLDLLQELSRNGKWKWILHYRDIRRLKENSRFNAESMDKKNLMKSSQETGIVEVLPYHECDQTCRPHPRYLKCLMQLQVQNITARFPVFVTDITNPTEDRSFERHGILTMNINTLLNVIERENFSPSTNV